MVAADSLKFISTDAELFRIALKAYYKNWKEERAILKRINSKKDYLEKEWYENTSFNEVGSASKQFDEIQILIEFLRSNCYFKTSYSSFGRVLSEYFYF